MIFQYKQSFLQIDRYPSTNNQSLVPWNAADEHILKYLATQELAKQSIVIYNDRFGFLSCFLHQYSPLLVISNKSHKKAILQNLASNQLEANKNCFIDPLATIAKTTTLGLIKIPKSLELFRLFLYQVSQSIEREASIVCSFMTRHFSPKFLTIAAEYFEEVQQSKAWKKSRLLVLKKPKKVKKQAIINNIKTDSNQGVNQYFGVFSAKHIDYASQFLIQHMQIQTKDIRVLDLASGNGILARAVRVQNQDCELHLLDDSFLAVESSKLNLKQENTFFHYNDSLEGFDANFFDLIISNPPFHFEYEVSIEVSIALFKQVQHCLKEGGHFQLVANQHLNYKTHLSKLFKEIRIIAQNKKFIIYDCIKK